MMTAPFGLFEAFGLELEYMLVDERLNVAPAADKLLSLAGGEPALREGEFEHGAATWSNELVLHVIELKNAAPQSTWEGMAALFEGEVRAANRLLAGSGLRLMPTGMHPWMNPDRELRLWPHGGHEIYDTFNRVFDCRGHGWANLQSVHLNLPFRGDEQFARLHAAVRLLLPLLPALSASSPICEGQVQDWLDYRLRVYMTNSRRVASVTGQVVPEPVSSIAVYEQQILEPMYREIAPLDPEGVLQHEWLNARGAVAKFSRHSLEIRVLDVQECPRADVAICAAITSVLEDLVAERYAPLEVQQQADTAALARLLSQVARDAEQTRIDDRDYLQWFGCSQATCTAGELWLHLLDATARRRIPAELHEPLEVILSQGPLARRILAATGPAPTAQQLRELYGRLCDCLQTGDLL